MSTARNRFGVSILVGFVLAVLCSLPTRAMAAGVRDSAADDESMFSVERVMSAASARTQLVVGLGAGVPLLIVGFMVRRRILAEL